MNNDAFRLNRGLWYRSSEYDNIIPPSLDKSEDKIKTSELSTTPVSIYTSDPTVTTTLACRQLLSPCVFNTTNIQTLTCTNLQLK